MGKGLEGKMGEEHLGVFSPEHRGREEDHGGPQSLMALQPSWPYSSIQPYSSTWSYSPSWPMGWCSVGWLRLYNSAYLDLECWVPPPMDVSAL